MTESSKPGGDGEVAVTVFTLLAEEDCLISSALAASLRGSKISSLIKWVLREMIKKEAFEQKTFILANFVGQGE